MRHLLVLGAGLALVACTDGERQRTPVENPADTAAALPPGVTAGPAPTAQIALRPTHGHKASGSLAATMEGGVLRLSGQLTGLTPNSAHGFHIHEKGDCSAPDASSAGAHFNPADQPHGKPDGSTHHAGDLFNVDSDAQGNAIVDVRSTGITLGDGGVNDVIGKSVVVHENPDDYQTQPSGNSGDRIACGVIEPAT